EGTGPRRGHGPRPGSAAAFHRASGRELLGACGRTIPFPRRAGVRLSPADNAPTASGVSPATSGRCTHPTQSRPGEAERAGRTATLPAPRGGMELDRALLAVAIPTPFKVVGDYDMRWAARGTVHHRHYRIDRGGFDGPIEVSLADRQARHLQGVTGGTITVPP